MNIDYHRELHHVLLHFGLGTLIEKPIKVQGGLMHTMFKAVTDSGCFAVKCLNPAIMSRETALNNTINSEKIAEILALHIPAIVAKKIDGKQIHRYKEQYYMFFDWFEGKSIYPPEICEEHCSAIGDLLGKIHSLRLAIEGVEDNSDGSTFYSWIEFADTARMSKPSWLSIYEESLEDIIRWNQKVLIANELLSKEMVISHRDLDPKNVLWHGDCPYVIDWEAAGYVNPYKELLEVLNYWADDGKGGLRKDLFLTMINKYRTHNSLKRINWDVIFDSGYEGMLGWLAYNVKRALGIEGSNKEEIMMGEQQLISTITALKSYQEKISLMKEWVK